MILQKQYCFLKPHRSPFHLQWKGDRKIRWHEACSNPTSRGLLPSFAAQNPPPSRREAYFSFSFTIKRRLNTGIWTHVCANVQSKPLSITAQTVPFVKNGNFAYGEYFCSRLMWASSRRLAHKMRTHAFAKQTPCRLSTRCQNKIPHLTVWDFCFGDPNSALNEQISSMPSGASMGISINLSDAP